MADANERIAVLETQLRAVREELVDVKADVKAIKSMLVEGRGAMRLVKWMLYGFGLITAGWFGHTKAGEMLKWLGT